MNFKERLYQYQQYVNTNLEANLRKNDCLEKQLNASMEYSLMAGGKRLRPILVIATYEIFKKDIEKCLPYAIAIEMVHNFSLIHDDLPAIDNDDFRHGKLSNHKKFNESTAILAGDGLLNNAYMVISEDLKKSNTENLEKKIKVFTEFARAVDRMIAGEYVDTEYEGKQISAKELEYIHINKTGALLRLCVRMGAILAEAPQEDIERLTRYAEKIGLAFQIKDDILSEEGDEEVLGKPVGNDKQMGKCTYVSEYGLDKAKEILEKTTKDALSEIEKYGEKAEFLEKIVRYVNNIRLEYITVYAFSTENWKRAEEEVKALMMLLQNYLDEYSKRADTENIRVKILGDISALSEGMQKSILKCMERTKDNTGVTFNIALNYVGRDEIIKAIKQIAKQVKEEKLLIDNINEDIVADNLYTKGMPDPDLLIRTSGELRLSNFLPWQLVYSEFLFIDKNWPEFTEQDLDMAILEYEKRTRKFGAN